MLYMWYLVSVLCLFFFFKQKTAYEMRISDWSSDVCSSDLPQVGGIVAIMPHNQRAAVSPGDEAVVAPAVDLQLVVVESVDQIAGDDAVRQRIALRRAERERRVGERRDPLLVDRYSRCSTTCRCGTSPSQDRKSTRLNSSH